MTTFAAYPAYQDSGVPRLGRIPAHWEVNSACHNQVISTLLRQIALLREYRTRLIADVVTGKLDVREAAARLPQEAEDLEPLDENEVEGETEENEAGDGVPEEAEA